MTILKMQKGKILENLWKKIIRILLLHEFALKLRDLFAINYNDKNLLFVFIIFLIKFWGF